VEELLASQDEVIARMVRKDLEGDDTAPDVVEEQIRETINKVKERREEKMKGLAKTVDHLERAKREEERPKTLALQKKMDEANKIYCEEQKKVYVEAQKVVFDKQLAEKQHLEKMRNYYDAFKAKVMKRREAEYVVKKAEQDQRLMKVREKYDEEMQVKRKADEERKKKMEELQKKKEIEEEKMKKREEVKKVPLAIQEEVVEEIKKE